VAQATPQMLRSAAQLVPAVTRKSAGAPDIPDHSDSPRLTRVGGNGRGEMDTCTLNSPAASFDNNTGTTPIASTVSRTAVGHGVSANHGYPIA
jgi:hypothetical protein